MVHWWVLYHIILFRGDWFLWNCPFFGYHTVNTYTILLQVLYGLLMFWQWRLFAPCSHVLNMFFLESSTNIWFAAQCHTHTHHEATMKLRSHATEFKIITIGQLPIIWSTPTYPKMVRIFCLFFLWVLFPTQEANSKLNKKTTENTSRILHSNIWW
jgi:hypothetical protein